ncbi:MAG: N-acetyltransferase family protein [Coriobacteriia bacterium]|nr:N-acetyltransferase family protein [Coriobacteriia bacterium]
MSENDGEHGLSIRFASIDDAEAILGVYTPYVLNTALTFESTVPSIEEFRARIARTQQMYPFLVCTVDDKIVGFAYAAESRQRDAYRWNAELSIYVDSDYHRRGIATALYTALFQITRAQGIVNLYAVIALPNDASVALHRHFGFREIGVHQATGYKFNRWYDVVWMHHRIEGAHDPAIHGLPTPIESLHRNDVDTAITLATALLKGVGT